LTLPDLFTEHILQEISAAEETKILQSVRVGQTDHLNELVFFIKPELLDVDDAQHFYNALKLMIEKFEEFDVSINGTAIVTGSFLEESEIMNRHYGFINLLSRKASEIVDIDTRDQIFTTLGIEDTGIHRILGGHEFLKAFDTDIETLSEVWFGKGAQKLRSGFYFVEENFQEQPVILVNGFHPSQLQHFTHKDHRILLMLLHTDTDWYDLKFELVGDTFPENAKPNSIRGVLNAHPELYGQTEVNINRNGVHLSAGPIEAAFEIVNFFGALLNLDPSQTPPLVIQKAIRAGLSEEKALNLLRNPKLNDSDVFSETENMNSDTAIEFIIRAMDQEEQ